MNAHIILQPEQIWMPAGRQVPGRRIVNLPQGMVSFVEIEDESHGGRPIDQIVSLSLFRTWIRENAAIISVAPEPGLSPAAELAHKVVVLRKAAGMTQAKLADALGLSRSAIAFLETGRLSDTRKHLPKLAELFGVPVDLFVSGAADQDIAMTVTKDESDLIEMYRRMSPELKINVQKYIERLRRRAGPDLSTAAG